MFMKKKKNNNFRTKFPKMNGLLELKQNHKIFLENILRLIFWHTGITEIFFFQKHSLGKYDVDFLHQMNSEYRLALNKIWI